MDELTPWEFFAAVEGWRKAHCAEGAPPPPSDDEHDALLEKYRDV